MRRQGAEIEPRYREKAANQHGQQHYGQQQGDAASDQANPSCRERRRDDVTMSPGGKSRHDGGPVSDIEAIARFST